MGYLYLQSCSLNSVRAFSFFGPKIFSLTSETYASIFVFWSKNFFFDISFSGGRTGERKVSTVPSRFPEQCARIFVFRSKKYFFDISISGGHTGERKVSTVPSRFPEQCARIFVFRSKNISLISQFLEVAQVKGRCQRYHRVSLKSVRAFSFFGPKIFLRYLDFWRLRR